MGRSRSSGNRLDQLEASLEPAPQRSSNFQRLRVVAPDHGRDPVEPVGLLPDDVPDDALIAAVVAGEAAALEALYERHAHVVFSLLVRILGDRDEAEEHLQEVFLRAWQQAHTFDEARGAVRSWLQAIAHHLAVNELRRRSRRPHVAGRASRSTGDGFDEYTGCVDTAPNPSADAWCAVRNAGLARALDQLSPGQREVLELYAAGFSQSEIAAELGEPLGTIKSRMRRALCRLRELLPAFGIDAGWPAD